MGEIIFLNEEARKMFLSLSDKNKNTGEESYLSESLKKLIDAVDRGLSYEQIKQDVVNPIQFAREYWMGLYATAETARERREAILELRRLMLLIDGKPLID